MQKKSKIKSKLNSFFISNEIEMERFAHEIYNLKAQSRQRKEKKTSNKIYLTFM